MQNYFNYDMVYCMNITDIDDKVLQGLIHKNLQNATEGGYGT